MAKLIKNKKNYSIIKITENEAKELQFGNNGECLCANCNKFIKNDINYLLELDDTLCNNCLNKFLENHGDNKDKEITERYFNYYKKILGLCD